MHKSCWIVTHAINTVLTLGIWIAAVTLVWSEAHFDEEYHRRANYKTLEQALCTSAAAVLFVAFRVAHGWGSVLAITGQVRNPLMLRSAESQILCALYMLVSAAAAFFTLVNHAAIDTANAPLACAALQWIALFLLVGNNLFLVEQFSHPQLLYCCETTQSRDARRCDVRAGGGEFGRRLPAESVPLEEIDDVQQEDYSESFSDQ